ncbi:unnamed protein product, partial [marine sediment metagenome]
MLIELSEKDLMLIDEALIRAAGDVREYLRHGNVEGDYPIAEDLRAVIAMPYEFARISVM